MLKSKLVIKAAIAVFVIVTYLSPQETMAQDQTKGDCSPIVKDVTGDVSISCSFQGRTPVYKFSARVDKKNAQIVMSQLVKFIDKHEKQVFELGIWVDPFLKQPDGCGLTEITEGRSTPSNCRWSNYAYSYFKGRNSTDDPTANISLAYYKNHGCPMVIDIKGESVFWLHGDIVIQGYFFVKGTGFGQGVCETIVHEISKQKLLGSGRYNLEN